MVTPAFGALLPHVTGPLPGPRSRARVDVLARHECPAVTARRARRAVALGAADDDPVVWAAARGANVRDVDGNVLVDLTSGFGVALLGHARPEVVAAAARQGALLPHASGDAWPDDTRIALLERLAGVSPDGLDVALLGLSGSDAVEAAVKTAVLASGRPGVLAFGGSYHGLSLGALPLQGYKAAFADPFRPLLRGAVRHLPFGATAAAIRGELARGDVGLVLVEPILGRGGMRPAPSGWLAELGELARAAGALVAHDEIQSGLGRAGAMFAASHDGAVPDLLCVGKALGGGYPLSACLGTRAAMDAWGASTGEALHTQTFLGHPVGCAAALAVLDLLAREGVPAAARARGAVLRAAVEDVGVSVRGRGLMLGVSRALLQRGFLTLPAGPEAEVLGLTPPVTLTDDQIGAFAMALAEVTA